MLSLNALNEKYNIKTDFLSYHRIKSAIVIGSKRLNYKTYDPDFSCIKTPRQPILFKICNFQKKGCRVFYQTLRARDLLINSTEAAEKKWQTEINMTFSINFWDKCWNLIKNLDIDNKSRWLQFQIVRYILPTNYTVNKYNPHQDPNCSFCPVGLHLEKIPYLFWECPKVMQLWWSVENFLQIFYPTFRISKKKAIFGDTEANNEINTILMWTKTHLWSQKFTSKRVDFPSFMSFIKQKLKLLMMVAQKKVNLYNFLGRWGKIVEFLGIEILPNFTVQ